MSGLRGAARTARRCAAWLVPAGRREWARALWAEADEAPPGWQRLTWRAGGLRLIAREPVTRRRARRMLLFAEAAALMARATWRGAPNLSGALIVTVLGMGTIALMLHATWLRTLFDGGHHLNAVVVYSHEIDAGTNAQGYLFMCVAFPVIGLFMSMMGAPGAVGNGSEAGQGGPPRGGGPGQPGPAPDQPGGGWRVAADGGVERLTASPFPDTGRDDDEDRSDLAGAAARGPMTRTR
jgi:hypothetical protein